MLKQRLIPHYRGHFNDVQNKLLCFIPYSLYKIGIVITPMKEDIYCKNYSLLFNVQGYKLGTLIKRWWNVDEMFFVEYFYQHHILIV